MLILLKHFVADDGLMWRTPETRKDDVAQIALRAGMPEAEVR